MYKRIDIPFHLEKHYRSVIFVPFFESLLPVLNCQYAMHKIFLFISPTKGPAFNKSF